MNRTTDCPSLLADFCHQFDCLIFCRSSRSNGIMKRVRVSLRLVCLGVCSIFVTLQTQTCFAFQVRDELADVVSRAIKTNAEKLGSYRIDLIQSSEVSKPISKEVKLDLPDGGGMIVISPASDGNNAGVEKMEIFVAKNFFERRVYDSQEKLSVVWQFDGILWNHFDVPKRIVSIRRSDQLHVSNISELTLAPMEPRFLDDFINESDNCESTRLVDSEFGANSIKLVFTTRLGRKSEFICGSNSLYLPVIYRELSSGTIVREDRIEYEKYSDRNALFVKKVLSSFGFDRSKVSSDLSKLLSNSTRSIVLSNLVFLPDSDVRNSQMKWGQDWVVRDLTKWGNGNRDAPTTTRRFALLMCLGAILTLIPVGWFVRKFLRER